MGCYKMISAQPVVTVDLHNVFLPVGLDIVISVKNKLKYFLIRHLQDFGRVLPICYFSN